MWSIRMRASLGENHISGAEGIFDRSMINTMVNRYLDRAFNHSRGTPNRVVITLEEVKEPPILLTSLPVYTVNTASLENAWTFIELFLTHVLNVHRVVFDTAKAVIDSHVNMRGAAIIDIKTGRRLEPDPLRGVRATRLGITPLAEEELYRILEAYNLNIRVVTEAIVLATKVANHEGVVAELCVSDDPDYTTGYIASKGLGYIRIKNIKEEGDMRGGRVIFVSHDTDIEELIHYLQNTPVLINTVGEFKGTLSPDEAISLFNN